jgi:hypothetical protein
MEKKYNTINRASLSDQILASAVSSICSEITIAKPIWNGRKKPNLSRTWWLVVLLTVMQQLLYDQALSRQSGLVFLFSLSILYFYIHGPGCFKSDPASQMIGNYLSYHQINYGVIKLKKDKISLISLKYLSVDKINGVKNLSIISQNICILS